jgi:hypothetical protein
MLLPLATRFGPYGGIQNASDAQQVNLAGFNLVVPGDFSPELRAGLRSQGAAFLDFELWWLVHVECDKQEGLRKGREAYRQFVHFRQMTTTI